MNNLPTQESNLFTTESKRIKYTNELPSYQGKDCIFIEEGEISFNINLPYTVHGEKLYLFEDNLTNLIPGIIGNCILINSWMDEIHLFNYFKKVLKSKYYATISDNVIKNIINNQLNNFKTHDLFPYQPKLKYYWVNPIITNKKTVISETKKHSSMKAIDAFFKYEMCFTDCVVTNEYIANSAGVDEKTIRNYITKEQLFIKDQHNLNIRAEQKEIKKKFIAEKRKLKNKKVTNESKETQEVCEYHQQY